MHWNEMNCVANPSLVNSDHQNCSCCHKKLLLSKNKVPEIKIPIPDITHRIFTNDELPKVIKNEIINFIRINNQTESGNITELTEESFNRILSTRSLIGVLIKDYNQIIGTIITLIFKTNQGINSSYTTFLCVAPEYRKQGLAMVLIRAIMKKSEEKYDLYHGYYLTSNPHHNINHKILSWYRPLNVKKAKEAGFTLKEYKSKTHQRLSYQITKPKCLPTRATVNDYEKVITLLEQNNFQLQPTKKDYIKLIKCFDVYLTNNNGLFMLFPLTSYISQTSKRVRNAQLVMMITNCLSEILYIANNDGYDLLYGFCNGLINEDSVNKIHGIITESDNYLEFYNSNYAPSLDEFFLPIF